jgi:hypothetical protein
MTMDGRGMAWRAVATVAAVLGLAAAPSGAYAAVVTLPLWHSTYDWRLGDGSEGWKATGDNADPFAYGLGSPAAGAAGPWIWLTGDREYRPGGAEWHLTAPGTTRIAAVSLQLAYRDKLFAHHCLEAGLRVADQVRDQRRSCAPPSAPATPDRYDVTLADSASEPTAKEAFFRIEMPPCHNPAPTPCSKWVPRLDPVKNGGMVRASRIAIDLVDDDRPEARASGPLRELADRHVDGKSAYDVNVTGTDPGAGVRRVGLERAGVGNVTGAESPCDPAHHTPALDAAVCPPSHGATWSFDTTPLPEGAVDMRATAEDLAGNAAAGDSWRFFIDRTAPPEPSEFDVDLDADAEIATVSWLAADDPVLADGSPGSGLAEWEYRFRRSNSDWSDWHRGVEALEVPAALEGDGIDVEARSLDAVSNRSPIAFGHVVVPTEDEEDNTVENEDDDADEEPIDAPVASASRARARAAAADGGTLTLQFVAATADARERALADVSSACSPPLRRQACYDAVRIACRLAGICTKAKQRACTGASLYCPKADASRVSLVERYQPTFVLDRTDRFWPVSVNTALKMRWDGRETCLNFGDDCVARGAAAIRAKMGSQRAKHDNEYLDLPPHLDDVEDHWKATQDALGIRPRLDLDAPRGSQNWDGVPATSRVYWYRGGGVGRNSGTAKSVQYWTYFTYNYLEAGIFGGQGKHEGDWEMAGIVFSRDEQPVWVYMSRHGMAGTTISSSGQAPMSTCSRRTARTRCTTTAAVTTGRARPSTTTAAVPTCCSSARRRAG